VYRAVDRHGQIIDACVSPRRDTHAARQFFTAALRDHRTPAEVVTDRAWMLLTVFYELNRHPQTTRRARLNRQLHPDRPATHAVPRGSATRFGQHVQVGRVRTH